MKSKVGKPNHSLAKRKRYTSSAIVLVLAVGFTGSVLAGVNAALLYRDKLMSQAQTAATALSVEDVTALDGSDEDLESDSYENLKERMIRIRQDNPETRFVYLLGQENNNEVLFLVDSEAAGSPDYSPPGQAYPEASSRLKAAFSDDTPFVEGPMQDSYGSWVSGLAPIANDSGKTIALLGIDVPSSNYYMQIALYAIIPLLLTAIPVSVLYRNRKLEEKEREISDLKTQFVTVASHDLRSPLNGVLWGVQSLIAPGANPNITEDQHKILTAVYNSTASSLATVNEILDFSIFDRDKADKLQRVAIDLVDVLNDTQKVLALAAQEGNVTISKSGEWPESLTSTGDPGALKRAFGNVLSNAIKYSPKSTTIDLLYERQGDKHIISVRDHGIGIPEKEQAKVLEGYYRAGNATKVKAAGTGMGLWVTKKIIEQHHGSLELKSKENEGTTMIIALPVKGSS